MMGLIPKTKYLIVLAVLTLLTGCYSFIGKYGDPFYAGKDQHHFEKLIDGSLKPNNLGSDFTYRLAQDNDLRVVDAEQDYLNTCTNSELIGSITRFSTIIYEISRK